MNKFKVPFPNQLPNNIHCISRHSSSLYHYHCQPSAFMFICNERLASLMSPRRLSHHYWLWLPSYSLHSPALYTLYCCTAVHTTVRGWKQKQKGRRRGYSVLNILMLPLFYLTLLLSQARISEINTGKSTKLHRNMFPWGIEEFTLTQRQFLAPKGA